MHFFSGVAIGVYITQNYYVPNLHTSFKYILNQISYYEKNNKKFDK